MCILSFQNVLGKKEQTLQTIMCKMKIISIFFLDQISQADGPGNSIIDQKSDIEMIQKKKQTYYHCQKGSQGQFRHQQPTRIRTNM